MLVAKFFSFRLHREQNARDGRQEGHDDVNRHGARQRRLHQHLRYIGCQHRAQSRHCRARSHADGSKHGRVDLRRVDVRGLEDAGRQGSDEEEYNREKRPIERTVEEKAKLKFWQEKWICL